MSVVFIVLYLYFDLFCFVLFGNCLTFYCLMSLIFLLSFYFCYHFHVFGVMLLQKNLK